VAGHDHPSTPAPQFTVVEGNMRGMLISMSGRAGATSAPVGGTVQDEGEAPATEVSGSQGVQIGWVQLSWSELVP
jgi:hypothetical protein